MLFILAFVFVLKRKRAHACLHGYKTDEKRKERKKRPVSSTQRNLMIPFFANIVSCDNQASLGTKGHMKTVWNY